MEARVGDTPQLLDFCSNCQRPFQSFTPTSLDFPPNSQNAESHVQLEKLIGDIDCAVRASFPKPTAKYDAVHVLLLRWEADDLGTSKEIQDLGRVFQNLYGFETASWLIPSTNSYITLNQRILDFQKDKSERDLLILYYGGHGIGGPHSNESVWAATGNGYPQLPWSSIQPNLLLANCDVLFIFDCCYASRYDLRSSTMYQGSKEVLAACSMEDLTTGVQKNSFTRRLIEELEKSRKADDAYISSWQLHDRLMGRKSLGDLEYTPRFFGLSNNEYPCIKLCPIKECVDQSTGQTDPASQDGQDITEGVPSLIHSENTSTSNDWYTRDRRIIVSISLDDPTKLPSVMQWERWLTEKAPENIQSMRVFFQAGDTTPEENAGTAIAIRPNIPAYLNDVYLPGERFCNQRKGVKSPEFVIASEAMYKSDSTLLLLSLPIPVYKYLRRNPAYRYVGIIRSQNLLQRKRLSRSPLMTENVQEGLTKASRHWWWYKWYLGFSFIGLVWSFLTVRQLGKPAVMLAALFSTVLGALPSLGLLAWEESSTGPSDANWFPGAPRFLEPELNY